MHGSILKDVKKVVGVPEWDDGFDAQLIIFINTAISYLTQLGVSPRGGVSITGPEETWSSIVEGSKHLEAVKTYVSLKTRLLFDPPSSSFVLESIKNLIAEAEWRLNVQAEGAFDDDTEYDTDGTPKSTKRRKSGALWHSRNEVGCTKDPRRAWV